MAANRGAPDEVVQLEPSAFTDAYTRLWALMQTSPSHCHTDASFLVGAREVFVHSAVLLAWSRPLHSHIQLRPLRTGQQLHGVDPDAFFNMVQFFYTGRVRLTIASAVLVLRCALRFEVLPLVEICRSFIGRHALNEEDPAKSEDSLGAMGIAQVCDLIQFSAEHFWPQLHERTVRYTIEHLEEALDIYPGLMYLDQRSFVKLLHAALATAEAPGAPGAGAGGGSGGGSGGGGGGGGGGAKANAAAASSSSSSAAGGARGIVLLRAVAQWLSAGAAQRQVWDDKCADALLALLPLEAVSAREVAAMVGRFPILQQSRIIKGLVRAAPTGGSVAASSAGEAEPPTYASTITPPLPFVPGEAQQKSGLRQKAYLCEYGLGYGGTLELWERVQSETLRKKNRRTVEFDSECASREISARLQPIPPSPAASSGGGSSAKRRRR
jgi:uncharacterized membrane protein YgcG